MTESEADAFRLELSAIRARLAWSQEDAEQLRALLKASLDREQGLTNEVQHRVRNMLSVIRSVFRRTIEHGVSQDEFVEHLQGRLDAVVRYQASSSDIRAVGVELEEIVRSELLEAQCADGPNCTILGPVVLLNHRSVEVFALAIHELATNAIKFGALRHDGSLRIEWSVEGSGDAAQLRFQWIEGGVPVMATAPRARGFGRQHLEEALPYQLAAVTSVQLQPGGLACSISFPLRGVGTIPGNEESAPSEPSYLLDFD